MSYEIDPNKQYILAGDISGSMEQTDSACGNQARYTYMLEKFEQFIKASEDFDPDGPTVITFGEKVTVYRNTTLDAVRGKLEKVTFEGFTNTDQLIQKAWELHKEEKSELAKQGQAHPGTVLLVFTDGAPTNRRAVEVCIRNVANSIDRDTEFSIEFLTVGTIESDLQDYLHNLDEDLKGAKYDIVEVKKLEELNFMAAVAGSMTHQGTTSNR